jgi:hypothetical protein
MFTVQIIESSASLQVQSTKSELVKFRVFLHEFAPPVVSEGREFESLRARHRRPSGAPVSTGEWWIGVPLTGGTKIENTKNYNWSAGIPR